MGTFDEGAGAVGPSAGSDAEGRADTVAVADAVGVATGVGDGVGGVLVGVGVGMGVGTGVGTGVGFGCGVGGGGGGTVTTIGFATALVTCGVTRSSEVASNSTDQLPTGSRDDALQVPTFAVPGGTRARGTERTVEPSVTVATTAEAETPAAPVKRTEKVNGVAVVPDEGAIACFDNLVATAADRTAGPTTRTAKVPNTSAARQTETRRPSCFIGSAASVISPTPSSLAAGPPIRMHPLAAARPIVP
jgi:hypothetical protein